MNKINFYFKYFFLSLAIILAANFVVAAPVSNIFRNIMPEVDVKYEIGTSTLRWLQIYTNKASTTQISTTASSTFSGGIIFESGNLKVVTPCNGFGSGGKLTTDANGNVICAADTGGSGSPGGSDTQVQFNDGGSFAGATGLIWNKTTNVFGVGTTSPAQILSVQGVGNFQAGTSTLYSALSVPTFIATSSVYITGTAHLAGGTTLTCTSCITDANVIDTITLTNITQITNRAISDTTGTLTVARGGTGVTTFGGTNTILYTSSTDTLASNSLFVFNGTNVGIGTTTPGSLLSVQGVGNFNAGTSTLYASLAAPNFYATSTTATSTFAGGILSSGGIKLINWDCSGYTNSGKITTDSSGNLICAADSGGSGTINSGTTNRLAYYSGATTLDSANFLTTDISNSRLGIGSTTPGSILSVQGVGNFTGDATSTLYSALNFPVFNATSTTATSTFANGISLTGGCVKRADGTCILSLDTLLTANDTNITLSFSGRTLTAGFTGTLADSRVADDITLTNITQITNRAFTNITGGTAGSIIFSDGSILAQNNASFFWDNSGNRLGLGSTTPGTILSVQGAGNFNAGTSTLYSGLTLSGLMATSSGVTISGGSLQITSSATSTSNNGIRLTGGTMQLDKLLNCNGASVLETDANGVFQCGADGGGASPTATVTTHIDIPCNAPRTIKAPGSINMSPGNAFYAPIDMTNDELSMSGWTFTAATSSEIVCLARIPQNLATTPNAILELTWMGTSTSALVGVIDVDATAINQQGGNFDTVTGIKNILASTTAGHRITMQTTAFLGTSTVRDLVGITLTAGQDVIIRIRRFGADANDTIGGDLYMLEQKLKIDVNVN